MTEMSDEQEAALLAPTYQSRNPARCSMCELSGTHPKEYRIATLLRVNHKTSYNQITKYLLDRGIKVPGLKNHFTWRHHERGD